MTAQQHTTDSNFSKEEVFSSSDSTADTSVAKGAHHGAPHFDFLYQSGCSALDAGNTKAAKGFFVRAEKLARKAHSQVAIATRVTLYLQLANIAEAGEDWREAKKQYLRGLELGEEAGIAHSPLVGVIHNNLAGLYKQLKDWAQTEYHYKMGLLIFELHDGPFSERVATMYGNLASYYAEIDFPYWAIRMLQRQLRIVRFIHGGNVGHAEVQSLLIDLGAAYLAVGDSAASDQYFGQVQGDPNRELTKRIA